MSKSGWSFLGHRSIEHLLRISAYFWTQPSLDNQDKDCTSNSLISKDCLIITTIIFHTVCTYLALIKFKSILQMIHSH